MNDLFRSEVNSLKSMFLLKKSNIISTTSFSYGIQLIFLQGIVYMIPTFSNEENFGLNLQKEYTF